MESNNNNTLQDIVAKLGNDLPKINMNYPKPPQIDTSHLDATMDAMAREREETERKENEFREAVVNTLKGIEKNTALLTEMTLLLQKSSDKQEEIFTLMVEILAIMKSANQEEAESKYVSVMRKITALNENFSTIQSLVGMANTVVTAYQALPF